MNFRGESFMYKYIYTHTLTALNLWLVNSLDPGF